MAREFVPPDFIDDNDPDDIHERMMANLPADIDSMPGGFPWDFTYPTAIEKSQLVQYELVQTLMLMFPEYAYGEWLDLHGNQAGVQRREAGYASGEIKVCGVSGTIINAGTIFCTTETDYSASIEFATSETCEIGIDGEVLIPVIAVATGTESNVSANTIILMASPIEGVTSVTNLEKITGGTEEEDDETLQERIAQANIDNSTSYIGNDSDYIRWAKEVVGVGSVIVIPEWDGPGTVKLVIMDANGMPANESILEAVDNHIMSPGDRLQRKAPIGASLTVVSADNLEISYRALIELADGYELGTVISNFRIKINNYYATAKEEGQLKYSKVFSLLTDTAGVSDFTGFLVNQDTINIDIPIDKYPATVAIDFQIVD